MSPHGIEDLITPLLFMSLFYGSTFLWDVSVTLFKNDMFETNVIKFHFIL